jgi:hypothetical protein
MGTGWPVSLAILVAALAALPLAACDRESDGDGDGDGDADADADSDADGDADGDGDADADADADQDGDAGPTSCTRVAACVASCGTDNDCAYQCALRICGPAGQELLDLTNCSTANCGGDTCLDRQAQACQQCIAQHCPVQTLACYTSSCEAGKRSCAEVTVCLAYCREDTGCADDCRATVCDRGGEALDGMWTCLEDQCGTQCDDLGSQACGDCLQDRCMDPVNACLQAPCEV